MGQQNEDHTGFDDCEHDGKGEMPHPTTVARPRSAEEPTPKKIKPENAPGLHADADDSSQTSTSPTYDAFVARTYSAYASQTSDDNTRQMNTANADHQMSRVVANSETSQATSQFESDSKHCTSDSKPHD